MAKNNSEDKPRRLYFKTYLKVINNSVGTNMFRNFYVETDEQGEFDAFGDGENSCAFYVSAILVMFNKMNDIHGLVQSTVDDLKKSGWQLVEEPRPGDVLIWEAKQFSDGSKEHIGFCVDANRAVSTSNKTQTVVEHDINFSQDKRKVTQIYRMADWDNDTSTS